jgi:hypothetical protein
MAFLDSLIRRLSGDPEESLVPSLDRMLENLDERIRQLTTKPALEAQAIFGIELEDGIVMDVAHGVGRTPVVLLSPPTNAVTTGRIEELTGSRGVVKLRATGYGATITVNVWLV